MTMLPDIDAGSWLDYQRQEVERKLKEQVDSFGLDRAIGDRIASLQGTLGGVPEEQPPVPEPAPSPAPVTPAPMPEVPFTPQTPPAPMPEPPPEVIERGARAAPMPGAAPAPAPIDYDAVFNNAYRSAPNKDAFVQAFNQATDDDQLARVENALNASRTAPTAPVAGEQLATRVEQLSTAGGDPAWLNLAKEQLNKPYIWGSASGAGGRGTGDIDPQTGLPRGFDCSGYVSWVLKQGLGVDLPAYTGSAYGKTTAISQDQARPGDIVFYNMGNPDPHMQHMALYIGDGQIIQAGGTRRNVNIAGVNSVGQPEFRRAAGTDAAEARQQVGQTASTLSTPGGGQLSLTTAEMSGGGRSTGLNERAQSIMAGAADAASWLGPEGQKALQAILVTEGGMNNARGDKGQSAGPLQFYAGGGQLNNLMREMGMTRDQAMQWVEQNPVEAVRWAVGTPDKPGYLGSALQKGIAMGTAGPALATFAQRTGQVSVSPERAGANYNALFGAGGGPIGAGQQALESIGNVLGPKVQQVTEAAGSILGPPAQAVSEAAGSILGPQRQAAGEALGSVLGPAQQQVSSLLGPQPQQAEQPNVLGQLGTTIATAITEALAPVLGQAQQLQPAADIAGRIGRAITPGGAGLNPEEAQNLLSAAGTAIPGVLEDLERQKRESLLRSPQEQLLQAPLSAALGGLGQMPPQIGPAITAGLERAGLPGHREMGFQIPTPFGDIDVGPRELAGAAAEILTPGPELGAAFANAAVRRELAQLAARGAGTLSTEAVQAIERMSPSLQRAVLSKLPAEAEVGFAMGMPTGGRAAAAVAAPSAPGAPRAPRGWDPRTDVDPANRIVGQMLDARPEKPDMGNLFQRGVRAWTNRYEAPDRYMEETLREAGITGGRMREQTPEHLDLSALLREQSGDPMAKLRIDRDLQPAVRLAGEDGEALSTYLIHQNTVDTAQHIGQRVEREFLERDIGPIAGEARLQRAEASVRMRTRQLMLAEIDGDPEKIAQAQRNLSRSERAATNAQRLYDESRLVAEQTRRIEAGLKGEAAARGRVFSGGLSASDSERALHSMRETLGPERFAKIEDAANGVYDFVRGLRETMVDSGLISRETADEWDDQMPHWVPTRILDYLDEGGAGIKTGTKISLSDNGVRKYSIEGTKRFREDPLGSLIGLTHQVESKARRNRVANAFVDLDNLRAPTARRLEKTDRPPTADEPIIQRINNGTVERYVAPPDLAAAINSPLVETAPGLVRSWVQFYRNLITSLSPAFALVRNPTIDIPTYFGRELIRAGGSPMEIPRLIAALGKGYADAFEGLPQGEYRGAGLQQYLEGGGGMSTLTERGVPERAEQVQRLRGDEPSILSRERLMGLLKDLATTRPDKSIERLLSPVAALSERMEYGPRIAAQSLAEERGATRARATLAGRTVTMDFNEAGTLSRMLNSYIPFFNVGVQSPMVLARAIKEDPVAAGAVLTYTIGLPTAMTEAWNRSDPKRSRDYDDIPQYIKDQGIVMMLPFGEDTVDRFGNRVPPHYLLRTGSATPFTIAARQATNMAMEAGGNRQADPQDWGNFLKSMTMSVSPIRGGDVGDVALGLTPEFLPGMSTALQLSQNRDFFRNRDIVSERRDREAPQLAREIGDALTSVARLQDPKHEIHPSQVDFATRDMLGGWANILLGARELAPGAEPRKGNAPQDIPVAGGLARAAGLGGTGGELLYRSRGETVSADTRRRLQAAGIEYTPSPTETEVKGVRLNRDEQTAYQEAANRYVDEAIQRLMDSESWSKLNKTAKEKAVQRVAGNARNRATVEALRTIPIEELRTRRAELKTEKAS